LSTPEIRSPRPDARNPKPDIRNPKPETRYSKFEIRNPKPETRIPNLQNIILRRMNHSGPVSQGAAGDDPNVRRDRGASFEIIV
jgi:hypothetical protein